MTDLRQETSRKGAKARRFSEFCAFFAPWRLCVTNAFGQPELPSRYTLLVSATEIKTVVDGLSPAELTELAAFIRERDNAAWDRPIASDFSETGRLSSVAEEVREDSRAGRLQDLP